MADYYSLISRAIAALPQQTADARQAVYERARKALFNQLRSIQPSVAEADISAEGRALEEAIARLEQEIAAKSAAQPPAKPSPAKTTQPSAAAPAKPEAPKQQPAAERQQAPEPTKPPAPPEPPPAERSVEEAWRDTLAASETETPPREAQRPAAPLPLPPRAQRPTQRIWALAGVLAALIAVVGGLAWYLRERPEDLAKLQPAETSTSEAAESGKFDGRVAGGASAPAPVSGKRSVVVPVAQKAELWVATLQAPDKVDRIYNGTVVWRLENVGGGPGEPVSTAIRGDLDIPDGKMKLTLLFQKNNDSALSASHTVNVSFKPAPGSPLGGVKAIGPIQMRRADAQAGEKVFGIPVPITENNFLIGLMRGDHEARNVQLLRSLAVIDLPLQFADGRPATINMEKGPSGDRVFADAIDSWTK
ncbi:hypothetical protein OGR47_12570 [Methylocystis sp. MJC1]|jgi:hypothetical protein|uniref:hypothetical protein n=1 Tax=Methylocystis sp. MJC1 TaxID=2654282 RepID=UPI0013EDECBD|nr:hypothetical protein [Methylocystis sp. MJC1]KAF2990921.1 hypothetical protein MJC1_02019 [Methylocystis sp. MJC1]MBU6527815.1 hypothetical protein [Methylocystis sp. MJC1]UZX10741.1 hypothetical protein OGR47_12570 [Methylocystis sp. MJC1]